MEQKKYFFAVDLGATSGRTIVGSLSDGKFVGIAVGSSFAV